MRFCSAVQGRFSSRSSRVRLMMQSSSASRCGRSSERWSWSHRREKSSPADCTAAGLRPRMSEQRKTRASSSSFRRALPTSKRRLWKFMLHPGLLSKSGRFGFIDWTHQWFSGNNNVGGCFRFDPSFTLRRVRGSSRHTLSQKCNVHLKLLVSPFLSDKFRQRQLLPVWTEVFSESERAQSSTFTLT